MTSALLLAVAVGAATQTGAANVSWRAVARGVTYAAIIPTPTPSVSDGRLHVVKVDPSTARLRALAVSQVGGVARTARQWRQDFRLVAVINAGMYDVDHSRHTGYFRLGDHVNSSRWVKDYQSILLLDPRSAGLPRATIRDAGDGDSNEYGTVVQNLRLIRAPGAGVWAESGRRWSEAAVAMDGDGAILFLFSRSPYSMHELNRILLALPLGIVRAMHVEGGPEASLSVRGAGVDLDLSGSYETSFNENDRNQQQWPLPNVLGVEAEPVP
jgi:uncharacterized protein YigE (DUF2233 family)